MLGHNLADSTCSPLQVLPGLQIRIRDQAAVPTRARIKAPQTLVYLSHPLHSYHLTSFISGLRRDRSKPFVAELEPEQLGVDSARAFTASGGLAPRLHSPWAASRKHNFILYKASDAASTHTRPSPRHPALPRALQIPVLQATISIAILRLTAHIPIGIALVTAITIARLMRIQL